MSAAVGSLLKDQAKQTGVDPNNPGVYNGRPRISPVIVAAINGREIMVCANDVASSPTNPPNAASASQII